MSTRAGLRQQIALNPGDARNRWTTSAVKSVQVGEQLGLESTSLNDGEMTRMVDRWIASPLGKSRLIALVITMVCLLAMIAIASSESMGPLSGIF